MLNRHINSLTRVLFLSALSSAISSSLSNSCSRQRFSSLVSTANSCRVTRGCCYWLSAVAAVWDHVCNLSMLVTRIHSSNCKGHRIHTLLHKEACVFPHSLNLPRLLQHRFVSSFLCQNGYKEWTEKFSCFTGGLVGWGIRNTLAGDWISPKQKQLF